MRVPSLVRTGVAACLFAAPTLAAPATLTVGPGGAFADIQSAIDAAVDGDIILVEPGTYEPFVIAVKGVTVRALTGFTVDDTSGSGVVRIVGVPPGQRAAIEGMQMTSVFGTEVGILAEFCLGEVVVEQVTITDPGGDAIFHAEGCSNLFVTDLTVLSSPTRIFFPASPVPVSVKSSSASFHRLTVNGSGTFECLQVGENARVTLSASTLSGPKGFDSAGCIFDPDGGIGGAGAVVVDADLTVVGDGGDAIRGGPGGTGSCGSGGDGGPGVQVKGTSNVIVSSSSILVGGPAGSGGGGPGSPGPASDGPVDSSQILPLLTMSGIEALGSTVILNLDAAPPVSAAPLAVIAISGQGGFVPLPGFDGPPASALIAGPVVMLQLTPDALGDASVSVPIPLDPALDGYVAHMQAAVLDPLATNALSNVVVRILGS